MSRRERRRASRHRAEARADKVKTVVAALGTVAVLGIATGLWWFSRSVAVPVDQVTLCRLDREPPVVLAILLDLTDRLSTLERTQVFNALERAQLEVPVHGLLELYTLTEDASSVSEPKVSVCNPGRGADMNELYQNPKLAEKRWDAAFRGPIVAALESTVESVDSTQSPILEGIRTISASLFTRAEFDRSEKRLVLVSDLLQHSQLTSHYRTQHTFEQLKAQVGFGSVSAPLSGVRVDVLYISRPGTARLQTRQHIAFWEAFVAENDGELMSVKRVHGE